MSYIIAEKIAKFILEDDRAGVNERLKKIDSTMTTEKNTDEELIKELVIYYLHFYSKSELMDLEIDYHL